jgi:sodium-dependent dicarboxylate transporter 2/3/5
MTWEDAVKLPWGILLLFGGGLALAQGFSETGLADFIGQQITSFGTIPLLVLLLVIVAALNFLTEITSNLATTAMMLPILAPLALAVNIHPYATTAMMLPILAPLALAVNIHPYVLMVGATLAASCAFMLPVATPPNAVVFGSGYLKIYDMARVGIWMNFVSILILTCFVYLLLPLLWNFEPLIYPIEFIKQ